MMLLTVYTVEGRKHLFQDKEAEQMLYSIITCSELNLPSSGEHKNTVGAEVCFCIKNIASYEVVKG